MVASTSGSFPAPAKINLFLHVLGRRVDGYHNLQTVFQFLDRYDRIELTVRPDGLVNRTAGLKSIPVAQDLAVRAARCLQAASGCALGVDIGVYKHIPVGSGLGGGSSNAATVLVALDRLWNTHLGPDRLCALGLQLGADVPVFIRGRAAWAEGVGEILSPLRMREPWYLVVVPSATVKTSQIFSHPKLTRDSEPLKMTDFLQSESFFDPSPASIGILPSLANDCEAIVCELFADIAMALDWLNSYAPARLTGTGSAVFAAFEVREQAEEVLAAMPTANGWTGWLAKGLNQSPLGPALDRHGFLAPSA